MAMSAPSDNLERLDELQRNINNVLVQTSKALKMAAKGSRPTPASLSEASSSINSSISSSYYSFNYALDDLEHEINRAKAVLLRDLNELKAKRMTPPPEPKPAAPPAPMDFQVDGPSFDLSSVTPAATSAQSKPFEPSAPDRLIKEEAAPVALFLIWAWISHFPLRQSRLPRRHCHRQKSWQSRHHPRCHRNLKEHRQSRHQVLQSRKSPERLSRPSSREPPDQQHKQLTRHHRSRPLLLCKQHRWIYLWHL